MTYQDVVNLEKKLNEYWDETFLAKTYLDYLFPSNADNIDLYDALEHIEKRFEDFIGETINTTTLLLIENLVKARLYIEKIVNKYERHTL